MDRRNRLFREKVVGEYPYVRDLPPDPVPEYVGYRARLRRGSTIRVNGRILGSFAPDRRGG